MNRTFKLIGAATFGLLAALLATAATPASEVMDNNLQLTREELRSGVFTPSIMWKMGRVGSSSLSPDGQNVVFTTTYYDVAENKGNTSVYTALTAGSEPVRLTDAGGNDLSPAWSADGGHIYYMSDRGGSMQLWRMGADGSGQTEISSVKDGIEGFIVSPTGDKVAYVRKVKVEKRRSSDIYPDMDKSKALVYDDLMARHWDYWDEGEYSHIFVAEIREGRMTEGIDIMPGEAWDAPMAPYFDMDEITWSNSGRYIAYTCKKMTGTEYAQSTDSDIYLYDVETGSTKNLTPDMPGYDKYPVFSPDDSRIAFRSMERPGNEADKDRLMVIDDQGMVTYITANFDYNAQNVVWQDNKTLLFIAPIEATHQICRASLDGNVEVLTEGDHDINHFSYAAGNFVAEMTTLSMATELFRLFPQNGSIAGLTSVNRQIYDKFPMGKVEKRWVTTTDDKEMLTWVVYPPDFDPSKKYPVLLYCQGGPQSVVSQFWSYRWNLQLMAAQGYIVVAPNRRGLPSFGQEWLDQISGDYSGQNIRDYLSAIDDVAREPWADENRMGCVGASYGGYSVFYLAGHHQGRFKAFIAHCGIYDFVSMYGSTEELFFVNNDYGGSYWSENPTARRSYANSPHMAVQNWDTPILIITGLKDFRIPYTQSLEAFTAARVRGIPSRLVAFEDEAHQVFKPQNSLVWNGEFFDWLDKYVKNP